MGKSYTVKMIDPKMKELTLTLGLPWIPVPKNVISLSFYYFFTVLFS